MKLLQLTLEDFQGIRRLSLNFDGKSASVYGDNATGKTTLYNALTWLLFDKASTGAKNFTPKTREGDGEAHHLDHSAEGVFQTDEGRIVTFKKVYHEVYKKKRGAANDEFSGHTVDYYIDGVPEKEKTYTDAVLAFCGGDAEKPKMLTMPDYFPEVIDWQTRRKILLEVCGDITDEKIITSDPALSELPDFLRMTGTSEQYYTIEEYRKIASAKKTEINDQLKGLPKRIDEATLAIPDIEGFDREAIEKNVATLEKRREELMMEKASAAAGDTATAAIRQSIADLRTRLAEGRAEHTRKQTEQNSEVETDIMVCTSAISRFRREIEDIQADIARKNQEIERLGKLRSGLLDEYRAAQAEVFSEDQTICPTCGQPLPAGKVAQLREEFNLRRSQRLEAINVRGKKEASKEMVAALTAEKDAMKDRLADAQRRQIEAERQLSILNGRLTPTTAWETTQEYADLTAQISNLTEKLNDAGRASAEAQSGISERIQAVSNAIREEQDKLMSLTMAENQRRRIAELEKQEKRLSGEYDELEKGLHLCDLFTKAKVDALTDRINTKFHSVRFQLFKYQINGGLKEGCEVMVPDEDGTLVPFADANNAARINAGLEIIDTLSEHWGITMPVVVDNAESVTHIAATKGQLIRLVVSEADKKLRLEVYA